MGQEEMSRTDKDRPYWVKENDEGFLTDHNHLLCGKEVYKRAYRRDEDGNFIYERRTHKRIEFNWASAEKRGVTYEQAIAGYTKPLRRFQYASDLSLAEMQANNPTYGYLFREREVDLGMYATYDMVLDFVYPDECTAGQKYEKGSYRFRSIKIPCTPMLGGSYNRYSYADGPRKDDRRIYNSGRRAYTRDVLRDYAKKWNSEIEIEETEYITERHRHGISWWY